MNPGRPRKLTAAQVREIRDWYELRRRIPTPSEMATRYGVSATTLTQVATRREYKEIR